MRTLSAALAALLPSFSAADAQAPRARPEDDYYERFNPNAAPLGDPGAAAGHTGRQ